MGSEVRGTGLGLLSTGDDISWCTWSGRTNPHRKIIVWEHSAGQDSQQIHPNEATYTTEVALVARALAQADYVVVAYRGHSGNHWYNQAAQDDLDAVVALARGTAPGVFGTIPTLAGASGKIGLLGHSMGGFSLSYLARHLTGVAACCYFAPATDGDFMYGHGFSGAMNTAYGGNWTANGRNHVPSFDPLQLAAAGAFATAPPILVYAGQDDPIIPPSGTGSPAAFAAASGAPNITSHVVAGDHVGMIASVDPADVVAFFDQGAW